MRSHVVGSTVSSITSVRTRFASLRPITSLRVLGWAPLRATAPVPNNHLEVPDRLLRLGNGDTTSPKLVEGGLRGEQLIDGVGHPLSMIDAWDIPASQVRTTASCRPKAEGERFELSVRQ
jgi:hypothetical protein